MNHSWYIHYKNKYPKGSVRMGDDSLDVYTESGEHVVALRKNGAGQMVDQSEELGLRDRHCLAPIPKDARLFKMKGGKVSQDEKAGERAKVMGQFVCPKHGDRVKSCDELSQAGFSFDEKQKLVSAPEKPKAPVVQAPAPSTPENPAV